MLVISYPIPENASDIAEVMPLIRSFNHPNIMFYSSFPHPFLTVGCGIAFFLHSEYIPNIQGCGQRKEQARKQDARCYEFKLSVLAIVKVRRAELDKKHNCKY